MYVYLPLHIYLSDKIYSADWPVVCPLKITLSNENGKTLICQHNIVHASNNEWRSNKITVAKRVLLAFSKPDRHHSSERKIADILAY